VAAAGTFAAWFAHASVDWSHLVPGAAGVGLIAAAVLVTRPGSAPPAAAGPAGGPPRSARPVGRLVLRTVVSVGIAVAAVAIARPVLAAHYRAEGERALERDPIHALAKANQSLTLNSNAIETHYLKAAAYARLDDYRRARSVLLRATALEPHNFVPWALLGDVAVRRQDLRAARAWYTRAWRLNPRDTTLERLRRNPTS
jgi:tetratricopeptide (TPR) repeat protein